MHNLGEKMNIASGWIPRMSWTWLSPNFMYVYERHVLAPEFAMLVLGDAQPREEWIPWAVIVIAKRAVEHAVPLKSKRFSASEQ